MTATQAPTPGPLSATAAFVEAFGQSLDRDFAFWSSGTASSVRQVLYPLWKPASEEIRLAPTAPVEASGSEREHGPMCWGKTSASDEMTHCYCGSTDLRPQPSGETREDRLSAALIAMVEHFERVDAAPEDKAAIQAACEVWAGVKRDKALSARPLALGGQHSSGEDINWKSEWEAVSSLRIKDRAAMAQAVSEIVLDLKVRGYVSHDGDPNWCKEATAWEKIVVRNLSTIPAQPESLSEDAIRRRLIQRIEQWDGETEYDAEDIASLADDILHEFNGAPVLSLSALGYVSADAEAALKAGINRVIYPAPSAHASFPLYAAPVPAQDDDKLREAGWSVAVHNDYRLNGEAHTFWLWTHPDGRWIKGEGRNDADALSQCLAVMRAHPSPPPAADADRVRIAVEALERAADLINITRGPMGSFYRTESSPEALYEARTEISKALAALKSEAK